MFNDQILKKKKLIKICYLLYKLDLVNKELVSSKTFLSPFEENISKVKISYEINERF